MSRALLSLAALPLLVAADEIMIQVSPSAIIMDSFGEPLTIHTDIPRSTVDRDSVALYSSLNPEDALSPRSVYSDACGDLVAEFDLDAVKEIVAPPSVVFTLVGARTEELGGAEFFGTDEVPVKDIIDFVPIRGDANGDCKHDVADAVACLSFLFTGGEIANPCGDDVADANGDGRLNVGDPIFLLAYLFAGGAAPDSSDLECDA